MKIGTFTFQIPSFGPANSRISSSVIFDVFNEDGLYSAIPFLNEMELRLSQLPAAVFFRIQEGRVIASNAMRNRNKQLLEAIVEGLRKLQVI